LKGTQTKQQTIWKGSIFFFALAPERANFLFTLTSTWLRFLEKKKEKRKQLFKQFKNWLDSKQFSAAFLNFYCRNVSFSN